MARIKVDTSKFAKAASAIEDYVKKTEKNMVNADSQVKSLKISWKGKDDVSFQKRWAGITDGKSNYKKGIDNLKQYADFLRYAEYKYRTAQINAVNRVNSLPRW